MTALPVVERLPAHLTTPDANPDLLRRELVHIITRAISEAPRSLQVSIGPSEVGHSCARRIGYKLLDVDENPGEPNWKATVGTAIHAWLEEQMLTTPGAHVDGHSRWITEATVAVGEMLGSPITGHCDLYDRVTGTVVDWKTCGPTQLTKYRRTGPGQQYRYQAHLYGRGWARRGQDVRHVAVMFLPRNGELRDHYWWTEPYDERVALEALQRLDGIALTTQALGMKALDVLPTADAFCQMCPYFKARSTDLAAGCPGDPGNRVNAPQPPMDPSNPFGFTPK